MKEHKNTGAPRGFFLAVAVGIAMIAVIIVSKKAAPGPSENMRAVNDSLTSVAVPDTTLSPDVLPVEPDCVIVALPDTLGKDKRPAAEAGYEDGYLSGMDDGAMEQEKATYDETNCFPTPQERAAYVENYRKGYAEGYEDGRQGRQFNISGQ